MWSACSFAFLLGFLASALAGCGQVTPPGPPTGFGAQIALNNAAAGSDPTKEGSEAWQRTKGPYAWAYNVNVGSGAAQNRLLMYYVLNNYGASVSPPLGASNDAGFVAKMKDISGQFQTADPAHPVVNSIDLVDPVADGVPGPDKLYRHYRSEDDITHYLQVARDNKMLFFFDTQIGWSTNQREVGTLMKWLVQPDVNLALDPEWEMRPGDIPGQNRGRTTAASINWVIDTLSGIVLTQHLPPKILIVHKFFQDEAPDWDKIQLKPGVTLIICIDGQGPPGQKIEKYNAFAKGETNYLGFKIFLQVPCSQYVYCEEPIMTPKQILALTPSPVMVQYQ